MPGEHDVSHGDILHKLGMLEGKLDAMHQSLAQKHADISNAFSRLNDVEKKVAQGVILAVVVSLVMPIIVALMAPRIEFGPDRPSPTALIQRG